MRPSCIEGRLGEIQDQLAVLGEKDHFNLDIRRRGLLRLEEILIQRIADRHLTPV